MSIFLTMTAVFLIFVFLGIPVSFSIGLSTAVVVLAKGMPLAFVSQMVFTGLDSYTYLAIPVFILAGYLMEIGGLSKRLVNFVTSLVGSIHGGLRTITVLACALSAAISGLSPGTVAAAGAMVIPPMVEKEYDGDFSAALTASAGSLEALIPPSTPMVFHCIVGEVSIGEMFMAGFAPGLLMTAALALTTYVISKKNGYKSDEGEFEWKKVVASFREAIWPLFTLVIILDGIHSGISTPTGAAVMVVVYFVLVELFITKESKVSGPPGILHKGAATTGTTVFILASAMAFSCYLTSNQISQPIGSVIPGIMGNVHVILIPFALLCSVTGTFLKIASQVLTCTPLFLPTLKGLGVSPLYFGILLIMGIMLGMMTSPVGINLFVVQGISGVKIPKMTKAILPLLSVMLFVQILSASFLGFSIFLPGLFSK